MFPSGLIMDAHGQKTSQTNNGFGWCRGLSNSQYPQQRAPDGRACAHTNGLVQSSGCVVASPGEDDPKTLFSPWSQITQRLSAPVTCSGDCFVSQVTRRGIMVHLTSPWWWWQNLALTGQCFLSTHGQIPSVRSFSISLMSNHSAPPHTGFFFPLFF